MEKDSDLLETGTKGVERKVCERLPAKGSIIETTERNLLRSINISSALLSARKVMNYCFMN